MKFALKWWLAVLIVPVISACGTASPPAAQPADAGRLQTLGAYHWQLREALDAGSTASTGWSVAGQPALQMRFSGGQLLVSPLCNAMSAPYQVDGAKMTVSRPMATLMACQDPALMVLESRVGARLPEIRHWAVQPAAQGTAAPQLTLLFDDGGRWLLDGQPTDETRYGSAGEQMFLEIAPERLPCSHPVMPDYKCLQVRTLGYTPQGLKDASGAWENFYSEIEGFTHEAGVRKVLRVKRFTRTNAPADASKFAYVLDMVVESEQQP